MQTASSLKISIVVPFFNEEAHLERCIAALLSQEYPESDYEVIMVDNNSSDRSADIVRRHERVTLLSEERQGDFAARNRGIAAATGDVVAFTDSDTAPEQNWLSAIATSFDDENVVLLTGRLLFDSDSPALRLAQLYESEKTSFVYSRSVRDTYFGYTCNMAVRRSAFLKRGNFPDIPRNSEIVFLRAIIDDHGVDAVRYVPEMCVLRLELSSFASYLQKLYTYGRDYNRYSEFSDLRPLDNSERFEVFRRTVGAHALSKLNSMRLLSILVVGGLAYETGRRSTVK